MRADRAELRRRKLERLEIKERLERAMRADKMLLEMLSKEVTRLLEENQELRRQLEARQ